MLSYKEVPNGSVFKALKAERHRDRVVLNTGTFIKMGNSHSVSLLDNKDAIFALNMPCRIIDTHGKRLTFAARLAPQLKTRIAA